MSFYCRKFLYISFFLLNLLFLNVAYAGTVLSIQGSNFYINGAITNPNTAQQGLLPNSRMIQAIFDDSNPTTVSKWVYPDTKKWDPNRNTQEFINAIPTYRQYGLLAVTVGLQGGGPIAGQFGANQAWTNSAIKADGSLDPVYLARLDKVIRALDANGMVAIVSCFYAGQQNRVSSDAAASIAVNNVVDWLVAQQYTNVILEIANEPSSGHFPSHPALQLANVYKLVAQAKARAGGKILVGNDSNSSVPPTSLINAEDVVMMHGNGLNASQVTTLVNSTRKLTNKPILINEDSTSVANFSAATKAGGSWGYYDQGKNNYVDGFQSLPINWNVNTTAKKAFFTAIGAPTSTGTLQVSASSGSDPNCATASDKLLLNGTSSGAAFTVGSGISQVLTTGTYQIDLASETTPVSAGTGTCSSNLSASQVTITKGQTTSVTATYTYQAATSTGTISVKPSTSSDSRCGSVADTLYLDGGTAGTAFTASQGVSKAVAVGQHTLALASAKAIPAGGGQSGTCTSALSASQAAVTAGQTVAVTATYQYKAVTPGGVCSITYSSVTGTPAWDVKMDEFRVSVSLTGFPVDSSGNISINGSMVMKNTIRNFWADQSFTPTINGATGTFVGKFYGKTGSGVFSLSGALVDGKPVAMKVGDNPLQSLTINGVACH
ncbi:MAG: cellulase family glycosylhydrolase [Gammaproteobacteria bacterium]|nr:cellulase family glycosylhydrolase [Gammaproteobacteria bacterium]